jgi:succinate-semialdehyde dehydrogenase/glutarate-semialdehyde dehydrogenase
VVCAITPFNAPLNTVAHKIAPALAAGNAVVLKPAEQPPMCANHLARLLSDAGLPAGYFNVVHGRGETAGERLLANQSIDFYGFTGSTTVGERIRACIGLRHTSLELGNISSTIVCQDANLEMALPRIIASAFRKAGQVCTSIQKLFVQRSIYPELLAELKGRLATLKAGDPTDSDTFIGPLIDLDAATRVDEWIQGAVRGGASIVTGGERQGPLLTPTVLTDVPADCRLFRKEVFGPVICVIPFDSLDEAIDGANDSPYGLTAGIFTGNLAEGLSAARRIRVGSLHINETSSSRVDQMPSGGVKASGTGREGPRYAIEEMTEERLVTISPSRLE